MSKILSGASNFKIFKTIGISRPPCGIGDLLRLCLIRKGQRTEDVKQLVLKKMWKDGSSAKNMTTVFEPLDYTENRNCMAFLRKESQNWLAEQIQQQIQNLCE